MKQKSGWKRITLLRKTSFKKRLKILAGYKRQLGSNSSLPGKSGSRKRTPAEAPLRHHLLETRSGPRSLVSRSSGALSVDAVAVITSQR